MNKILKKVTISSVVSLALFSSVAPSAVSVTKADEIKARTDSISSVSSNAETEDTLSNTDLQFLKNKEAEILASIQSNPLVQSRSFSLARVGNNLKGLWYRSAGIRNGLRAVGLGLAQINAIARGVYVYSYSALAAKIATVAVWNWALGVVIGVSATAAIYAMGNFRLFY